MKVTVVGFGRFGELWSEFLRGDFEVSVHDPARDAAARARAAGFDVQPPERALAAEAVFLAVPISAFEGALLEMLPLLRGLERQPLLVDLLSVKTHPRSVFERRLPPEAEAMLAHPMFGPDSVRVQGFEGQRLVLDRFRASAQRYGFWKDYFASRGLNVVELSAEAHDRYAARSQGLTHFFGRILGEFGAEATPIDTLGARKLLEIREQVCNDSWQLFVDLQTYNPFTVDMRATLGRAQSKIYNQLLPNRVEKGRLRVGIQGGRGSFNEEAARYYLRRAGIDAFELSYLHTTENVLRALHEGEVDRGQFAIHNSAGGIVGESVEAMSRYNFHIIEEFGIEIAHALMVRPDADFERVDTVMAHPQVFRQCSTNLARKYPKLRQVSGEGERIDHAKVAELLGLRELPAHVATMGSRVLAELHGLRIIEENLQDLSRNFTAFLWVERPA